MKDKLKKWIRFLLNPRLLLCLAVAWLITNGWSYVVFVIGTYAGIHWMTALGGAWLTLLWLPGTPEKLVTVAIAIALLRWLFPQDQQTLAVLRDMRQKLRDAVARKKAERAARKSDDGAPPSPEDAETLRDE